MLLSVSGSRPSVDALDSDHTFDRDGKSEPKHRQTPDYSV
jgi:hypothetical protein